MDDERPYQEARKYAGALNYFLAEAGYEPCAEVVRCEDMRPPVVVLCKSEDLDLSGGATFKYDGFTFEAAHWGYVPGEGVAVEGLGPSVVGFRPAE
jgi:hypothetical protein